MKKFITILFFILLIIPNFYFYCVFFDDQKEISEIEQRTLQKIPQFYINNFYNGIYQEKLENGIADQMFMSQEFKLQYRNGFNVLVSKVVDFIDVFVDLSNSYTNIYSYYYFYGNSDYIISAQQSIHENIFEEGKAVYNKIEYPGVEKYIYFINRDSSTDFSSNIYNGYNKIIEDNFSADYYGFFNINSFDEYKKYFYQTDHHWNYLGSYKGYTEIIRLLLGEDEELIEPVSVTQYDFIFNGSYSKNTGIFNSNEKFTVYNFPKLTYERYANGNSIGPKKHYIENDGLYGSYYLNYYEAIPFETLYDYNNPEKLNLLVVSNSYIDAINDLIASHFNKTYFLDVRGYYQIKDEDFFEKYIVEKEIDKVLIVGDIDSFALY